MDKKENKFQERFRDQLKTGGDNLLDYVWGQKGEDKSALQKQPGDDEATEGEDLDQESAIAEASTRRKRFNAGFTKDLRFILYWSITVALMGVSAGLIYLVERNDLYYICFLIAAVALVIPGLIYRLNRKRFVIITPQSLMVGQGEAVRSISWEEIGEVKELRQSSKFFRWVVITDRLNRSICISSLIYPRFDLFMSVLRTARRYYEEGKDKDYTGKKSATFKAAQKYFGKRS